MIFIFSDFELALKVEQGCEGAKTDVDIEKIIENLTRLPSKRRIKPVVRTDTDSDDEPVQSKGFK